MSLGDWLNSVILQQAAEGGVQAHDDDEEFYGDEIAGVHQRLDDLSRRIEQFGRGASGPAAYAPKRARDDSGQIAELIARLDRRIDQFVTAARTMPYQAPMQAPSPYAPPAQGPAAYAPAPQPPTLDRAVSEIAARQRALSGNAAPAARPPVAAQPMAAQPMAMPAPMLAPVPTQDLSGLEDQLRRITDQIETLRKPGVEEAINALRGELGEIGRALNDAMPRHAIDTIEKQIAGLTHRIAEGRQNGASGGALAGVEQGLAEVRDALRHLTPAENLVGFNEAVHELARKIDLIVAQKDPATLNQLEHAITTLREMATHVASNEAVSTLAAQVGMLAEKVEHVAGVGVAGDALNSLEQRIDALSRALAERSQNGSSVPPRLEALVQSLSDKIELIQQSRGDNVAVGHLEDRIVRLVERLDTSDSRLSHLEAIERGLGDLLVHIQDIQAGRASGGLRAEDPSVDALKHDLARTQNALEAVNGTLGHVVDRLAMIEKDIRGGQRAPAQVAAPPLAPDDDAPLELTEPMAKLAVRAVEQPQQPPRLPAATPLQMPAAPPPPPSPPSPPRPHPQPHMAAPQPEQRPAPRRLPPANLGPIDPNLPPDEPIEPGSAPPRLRAGARIAASEAALGKARPAPAEGGKTSFIAAARRAAQAAMEQASARMRPAPKAPALDAVDAVDAEILGGPSLRGRLMKRGKSVLIAASIVAIVIGLVQISGNLFAPSPQQKAPGANLSGADAPAGKEPSQLPAIKPAPAQPPAAPGPSGSLMSPTLSPVIGNAPPPGPSLLNPPALNLTAPPTASGDVTGSIPRNAPARNAMPAPTTLPSDRVPVAIGSAKLRTAAAHGDPTAAYELAVRFAEGRGVPVSYEEAARWYERAAGKGLALAQFRYATLLEKGQGVKKDLAHARRLYLAAANQGNAKAMHNLAVLYAEGIDGRPDYATAAQWFRKAASRGVPDSQYNLGVLCARGLGTEKNLTESYKWFALASRQGDKEAARKSQEVADQLEPRELAAAQQAVQGFVAEPQPRDAISVSVPPGGWEEGEAPSAQSKGRTAKPMSLGTFNVGKR
ncbi:MAG: hypothetical protein ACK4UO_00755 [Pseudolabrys sp.]